MACSKYVALHSMIPTLNAPACPRDIRNRTEATWRSDVRTQSGDVYSTRREEGLPALAASAANQSASLASAEPNLSTRSRRVRAYSSHNSAYTYLVTSKSDQLVDRGNCSPAIHRQRHPSLTLLGSVKMTSSTSSTSPSSASSKSFLIVTSIAHHRAHVFRVHLKWLVVVKLGRVTTSDHVRITLIQTNDYEPSSEHLPVAE